ncbi:hypothetical protein D9547_07110 [Geobacillus stearothermophilus]|uniref:Uncharacterized protein n=1 Tax=Geobacillus stearothermophilus TaxID=1422 RepID=A0A3L7CVS5_GEOSE|nr:hypothetical protein D9549_07080 [Geobacillus stearothermophilus]RLQ10714.1 hypothetical protein D9547_07110 [Geobacillus stearothermophilus]RLQ14042.1 hypothetical protein D9548_07985 [Geobacillus stearothermophilus]
MEEGGEAFYAHVALHRFHWRPREFLEMDRKEKAFVIASIQLELKKEKEEHDRIKSKMRG